MSQDRRILHLRFALPHGHDPDLLQQLRRLLEDFTPRLQMLEPDGAAADLTGALRFWHRDARGITELIQLRAMAYYSLRSSAGVGPNRMIAAMACALTPPGQRTVIENTAEAIHAFLRPRPVRELPGIGTRAAATLAEYGLHTVADVADVPQLTLQRLLGTRAGRTLHERAHGRDPQLIDPTPAPASISAEHRFPPRRTRCSQAPARPARPRRRPRCPPAYQQADRPEPDLHHPLRRPELHAAAGPCLRRPSTPCS
ncbi:hypothetical protein AB0G67_47665 [Streptomyces sp. NPDC021056]|uniref:DNA polymerase Y family protein n=1 Tax=Streptomyces sp. NPDC021056 TaxID=3155012 RepID=UPI0033D333A5